jgi:hypothetical protein
MPVGDAGVRGDLTQLPRNFSDSGPDKMFLTEPAAVLPFRRVKEGRNRSSACSFHLTALIRRGAATSSGNSDQSEQCIASSISEGGSYEVGASISASGYVAQAHR